MDDVDAVLAVLVEAQLVEGGVAGRIIKLQDFYWTAGGGRCLRDYIAVYRHIRPIRRVLREV